MKTTGLSTIHLFSILLLSACSPSIASENPTAAPTSAPTQARPASSTAQVEWSIVPTTLEDPGAWPLYDFADPQRPDLFIDGPDGYELDPSWQPESVRYLYQWGGLGGGVFDSQSLLLGSDGLYYFNGLSIEQDQVDELLSAFKNLHPVSSYLAFIDHTDDYPVWRLDLRGPYGEYIEVYSASSATWEAEPWIVTYNGRRYAQYDGTLGAAIHSLFDGERGQPAASFYGGGREEDLTYFSTLETPPYLVRPEYFGLTQLTSIFEYQIEAATGTISGTITDYPPPEFEDSWGGGNLFLEDVTSVRVQEGEAWLDCDIAYTVPAEDTYDPPFWSFACPPLQSAEDQIYRVPIEVEAITPDGEDHSYIGELNGVWRNEPYFSYMGIPQELEQALMSDPDASLMLEDHVAIYSIYFGKMPLDDIASISSYGEVYFLGQADVAGQRILYTIGTPFQIEEGQLTLWFLDHETLTSYLNDALTHAFTRRIVEAQPQTVVNLFYTEVRPDVIDDFIFLEVASYSIFHGHSSYIQQCGSYPGEGYYPSSQSPYRGLGFNAADLGRSAEEFLVAGSDIVVNSLGLYFEDGFGDMNGLQLLALPPEFTNGEYPPFRSILFSRGDEYERANSIGLSYPLEATPEQEELYLDIIRNLAGTAYQDDYYTNRFNVLGILAIHPSGETEIVACSN